MSKAVLRFAILLACLALVTPAFAQKPSFDFGAYNSAIPTPEKILGYKIGQQFTPYSELERYLKTISAAAADRMKLVPYGKTYEGRTLYYCIISAPENLARVEEIRRQAARLADPRATSPEDAAQIAKSTPTVAWLSYNVHGNEASSTEAAIQVIYQLVAGSDERTTKLLRSLVIILDPLINPDGRERFVQYYRSTAGKEPIANPDAIEHQERWPGGRSNHYLFDLNRDWAWQSQIENQARLRAYREWNPVVHVDYHEMGPESTYFFAPPALPVNETLAPLLDKWWKIYGKGNAAAFDRQGIRYYTREDFDLFYPSYGDSWPSFNGAVGMTYEQAGGGGLALQLSENRGVLTLEQRAWHHFVSSIATLETTADNREARMRDFYEFRRAAVAAGHQGPSQAFYLVPGSDPERTTGLVSLLLRNGIEVQRATQKFSLTDLRDASGRAVAQRDFPAGTYVVDLAQPTGFLARALLEPEAKLPYPFFFDVTAWSLPLAAGLEGYWAAKPASVTRENVQSLELPTGSLTAGNQVSAYLFTSETFAATRLLAHLLEEDFNCFVAIQGFKIEGREYPAGTIVVPVERNPERLHQRVRELAEQERVKVIGVATHLADEGYDLGSNRVRHLRKPKIAVVTDSPVNSTEYGALWFVLEQRLGIKFTPVRAENLRGLDLADYNVLIFPPDFGQGRSWGRFVDKGVAGRIAEWIRGGGLVIGLEGGAVLATKKRAGWTNVTYRYPRQADDDARIEEERAAEQPQAGAPRPPAEKPDEKQKEKDLERKLMKWADRELEGRKEAIPGTIMRLTLDNTHPIGFGLGTEIFALNTQNPILELSEKGDNVAYYPKENFKVGGYLTDETAKKLPLTAHIIRERVGSGHVVLFARSPLFRGLWDGGIKLLTNSIFFGNVTNPYARGGADDNER
jgi:hypothetical protein